MKKKKQKQNAEWLARPKRHQRGPYVPPPDRRGREWGRSLLILLVGLLLPFLWFAGEELSQRHAKAAAVKASVAMTVPATTAPVKDNAPTLSKEEAEQAGRALGFLHTVGAPAFCILCVLMFCGISFYLFEEPDNTGPLIVTVIGAILISTVVSAVLWRYAYVPLVDVIWEACGGHLVPYKLNEHSSSRRHYGGSSISNHKWGENAALLFWLGMGLVAGAVSKLKAAAALDRQARRTG